MLSVSRISNIGSIIIVAYVQAQTFITYFYMGAISGTSSVYASQAVRARRGFFCCYIFHYSDPEMLSPNMFYRYILRGSPISFINDIWMRSGVCFMRLKDERRFPWTDG